MEQLTRAFVTHLHSDHTIGYPDLIFTPAVTGRLSHADISKMKCELLTERQSS